MERSKFTIGYHWDFITSFLIYTDYHFDPSRLTAALRNRITGHNFRTTINVQTHNSTQGLYKVSFGHTLGEQVADRAQVILSELKLIESELELALKMDTVKGLLKEE